MLRLLSRYWWVVALRGVFAIAFGILALVYPLEATGFLVLIFGAFAFVEGMISLMTLFIAQPGGGRSLLLAVQAVAGIATGILAFAFPWWVGWFLVCLIGAWAIVTGVSEMLVALQFRQGLADELWLVLSGMVSILFGVIALTSYYLAAQIIGFVIGFYAVFFGIGLLGLSFRLWRLRHHFPKEPNSSGPVVAA
jgi:uncharacterized membrane protein HdeD (DUF308 family)